MVDKAEGGKCRWREKVFVWKYVYASFIEFLWTHIYICTYIWMHDSLHAIYKCKFVMPVSDKPENAFFHCSMYCYSACHTAEEKKLLSNYATSCMCMLLWINIHIYLYIYILKYAFDCKHANGGGDSNAWVIAMALMTS